MFKNIFPFFNKNKNTEMTNNSEEQQTPSSTVDNIVELVIQPPTPEAKAESDAPTAVITTQPAQPMPEHDDNIAVVMWEATVTGRRLIDEMINLGSFYVAQEEKAEGHDFNEYVMPYGKLPLNVIRNYNLRIVDTGRYRMLKEIRNNKMLKSKSEVAACNDFASWLIKLQKDNFPDKKIVLVFFEPRHSKILQLFQALERFRLLDDVNKILLGCVNGWDLLRQQVNDLKDEHRMVLKALADHHLGVETPLESAVQRAQALHKILRKVHGGRINTGVLKENLISCDHLLEQVKKIKEELIKEAQWRPVFADMFRQGLKPRRRAGFLRHLLVESGITYAGVTETFKDKKDDGVIEIIKENIKGKNEADVEEVIKLLNQHLAQPDKPVRRGSGRRVPRTRSLCTATDLEKQQQQQQTSSSMKIETEENNNDLVSKVISDVIPNTPAVLSEV